MLVLARKPGESIRISDDVVLTILHIGRGRVQIGIEAPREIPIRREELAPSPDNWGGSLPARHASAILDALEVAFG